MVSLEILKKNIKRTYHLAKQKYREEGVLYLLKAFPKTVINFLEWSYYSLISDLSHQEYEFMKNQEEDYEPYTKEDGGSKLLLELINEYAESPDSIIELGSGAGRRLKYLYYQEDYELSGVELNNGAVELMSEDFPEVYKHSNISVGKAQDVITEYNDNEYDVLFFISALNNITKDTEQLFDEIARVTNDIIISIEVKKPKHGGVYSNSKSIRTKEYRDYEEIFTSRGFKKVDEYFAGNEGQRASILRNIGGENRLYTAWVFKKI